MRPSYSGRVARAPVLDPETRRAGLLAAARCVFAREGFHPAGVADICEEAGVARGTFYNYFESKRAIFAAVVDELMAEVLGVVVPIDVTRPIPPQVVANVDRLIRAIAERDVARVLLGEAAGLDAEGDAALLEFYQSAFRRIEAALETGQRLGVVRPGPVDLTARCLLGLIKEPVFQARLAGQRLEPERLVSEVVRLLTAGILLA